ncbi:long-chain fatty acid--CoA ligase [Subtercola sp. RTI3]|uniref:acyl-CoA synthetase n=1 Tax=Subtercola sp. RTI3 TaxID=3048639 RepID=UPI002B237157|nr:long-chain fatty acid--CoA ligase [Subtercola sp. RTI3]MEA9986918.1 long-chain fatty acid--CoA ligase [Subtercola sp. RTI3]
MRAELARSEGLGSWLHRRRHKSAGQTAIVFNDRLITYDELDRRVDALANALANNGVRAGDHVAFAGENHPAFLETLFAVSQLGAVTVALNARLAAAEIAYMLGDSASTTLIYLDVLEPMVGEALRLQPLDRVIRVRTAEHPEVAEDRAEDRDFDEVVESGRPQYVEIAVTLDDPALILYTSGTTGRPKGAVLTHGNLTWNTFNVLVDYDYVSDDVSLMISPMYHVAALSMGVLPTLLKGGAIVLEPKFDAGRALRLIEKYGVTTLNGVPTTFQLLCDHESWHASDVSTLRKLTCGGSPIAARVSDEFEKRGLAFSAGYGMTETSPGITSVSAAQSKVSPGSTGLPHFFVDMRVDGAEQDDAGVIGEIQVRGRNVFAGYWNNPDETARSFTHDGWFKSGDLGYLDEKHFVHLSGRSKDMIISGSENIYPAEIEAIIVELQQVAAAAVIGFADDRWGEVPWAFITVKPGHSLTDVEVVTHLSSRLGRYKLPKRVLILDTMPMTATGKVRKAEIKAAYSGAESS